MNIPDDEGIEVGDHHEGPPGTYFHSDLVDKFAADAWEEGARWCWDRSDYSEEELQTHLDESNPYKKNRAQ